jgi:hypothetical protein
MKRFTFISIAMILLCAGISFAGNAKETFAGPDRADFPRIREILSTLNLSADQETKTNAILDEAGAQVRSLRAQAKSSSDKTAIREQARSLRMETISKIMQVLTPDQQTAFREKLKALRQNSPHHNKPTTQPQN